MKKGTELSGRITDVDKKGLGVFQREGKTYSVPFAVPGDDVLTEYQKRSKKTRIAKLKEITTASAHRRQAPCPHAGVCGGCLWQHMKYSAQLELKKRMINRAFEKHDHITRVDDILPCPSGESTQHPKFRGFYRNRMDYAVGWKGELGLREYGNWNRYLDLQACLLLDEETPHILETVRSLMSKLQLEPWDNKFHRGNFKYVTIRRGEYTGERMMTLLFHACSKLDDRTKQEITQALAPFCTTLYLGEQPTSTDVEFAKTLELLSGKPYLREVINALQYDIHPNAFFQTNSKMAAVLQDKLIEYTNPKTDERILDLYCGLGFFSLPLARRGAHITGVELVPESIELARHNADLNGVTDKTSFIATPVEAHDWTADAYNTIIVDPSRAGLHPKVVKKLVEEPVDSLVYISCNYQRFADELTELKQSYELTRIEALDLFPQTPHVEVIAKLEKRRV